MSSEVVLIQADKLRRYCTQLFNQAGMPADDAFRNADNLVDADLKGVESHGVSRMPIYLKRLRKGLVNPVAQVKVLHESLGTAVCDACNSMGAVASYRIMDIAINKARNTGISFINTCNSNHYSAAGYFAQMALQHDMIGFTASNGPPEWRLGAEQSRCLAQVLCFCDSCGKRVSDYWRHGELRRSKRENNPRGQEGTTHSIRVGSQ